MLHPQVRLAAADALILAIDNPNVVVAEIADLATPMCQQLLALLANTTEVDLNCHLMQCMKDVMSSMDHHVRPAALAIAQSLPALWDRGSQTTDFDQQVQMRQSVIRYVAITSSTASD